VKRGMSRCTFAVLQAIESGIGGVHRSEKKIAAALGISERTLRRALKELQARGRIAYTKYHPERAYPTRLFLPGESGQMSAFDLGHHPSDGCSSERMEAEPR
jgi:predicted ArsR family transcriptional regulator